MNYDERAEELYLDIPEVAAEVEGLSGISKNGKLLFVSGQLPYMEGRLAFKGRLGLELTLDKGKAAARAAAVQALGVLKNNLKSLNKIKKIVHVKMYIATGAEFKDHKKVLLGATDLFKDLFGTLVKCSYEVVGVASLPEGAAVELAMVVEIK